MFLDQKRTVLNLFEITFLTELDKGLLDRLNDINKTLNAQWNRLQNIRNTVDNTGAQADRARNRVREAENLISTARDELDKAKEAISKVVHTKHILLILLYKSTNIFTFSWFCCQQDIKIPSTSGDPNNMTLLAEEARKLAEK